jgi:putative tryptophan/tyrosine transport system substrate-binding protein
MKRREFIKLLGGAAAAWPIGARAQQPERMRRIGVLIGVADDAQGQARLAAFRQGMLAAGWEDGRNARFDIRFAAAAAERARIYAAELVASTPDVILANAALVIAALQQQTSPVSSGLVESLARPGGNITGFSSFDFGLATKWLELLKDIVPAVARVGVLRDPTVPGGSGALGAVQAVAPSFNVELTALDVRNGDAIERGLAALAREPNAGLLVIANPGASVHLELIIALAARHRLPAVYPYRYFAASGGLISYGTDNLDEWRRAASYVDRILKGEKPADLPVQAPTKYELVINLKTAKALGLELPASVLARADEVIE